MTPGVRLTEQSHEAFMRIALDLAREAEHRGEVPVGAVVVFENRVLGAGSNHPIASRDPTAHAEILALRQAATVLNNYRLEGTILYSTLEPCPMCAGALLAARVKKLVFGARDIRFGGVRSKFRIADSVFLNHQVEIEEGVLGADCTAMMVRFFAARR